MISTSSMWQCHRMISCSVDSIYIISNLYSQQLRLCREVCVRNGYQQFLFIWHSKSPSPWPWRFLNVLCCIFISLFNMVNLHPDLLDFPFVICITVFCSLLTIDAYGEVTFDNELVEVSLALPVIEPSSPTSRPVTPVMMSQSGGVGSYQRQTSTPSSSAFQRQMSSTPTSVPAVKPTPVTSLALPPNTGKW